MNKITTLLGTGLAAIILGSCGPNLSTPKDTVRYCLEAFKSNKFSMIDKCLSEDSGYRKSKDRFENARKVIINYERCIDSGEVENNTDPWSDVDYVIYEKPGIPGCGFQKVGFQLKELPNKVYKLHGIYIPFRNI